MRPKRVLLLLGLTTAIMLAVAACAPPSEATSVVKLGSVTDYRSDKTQPLAKDSPAPDFQFTMPDGRKMFLNDLRGNVVLLNFWGVNCPYCVQEMPYLQKAYDDLSQQGVVILGINTGDSEKAVRNFVSSKSIGFPIVLDPKVYASTLYDARYLPTTVIIDKTGNIRIGRIGAYENADQITAELSDLLK
jgi:peroxiredoxin